MKAILLQMLALSLLLFCSCSNTKRKEIEVPHRNYFSTDGKILLQLYDTTGNNTGYWQVWNTSDHSILTQWGPVGSNGSVGDMYSINNDWMQRDVTTLIEDKLREGYVELDSSELYTLVLKTSTPISDISGFRSALDDELFSTGNTNGEPSEMFVTNTASTFTCKVVDPYVASRTLHKYLTKKYDVKDQHYFTFWKKDSLLVKDLSLK